jgi:predicted AAA+ superfamily ATPase
MILFMQIKSSALHLHKKYCMFIPRSLSTRLLDLKEKFRVISLTGPRQSGKTTLLRNLFPEYRYVSLENPDYQDFVLRDPRHFLNVYDRYVIFDEAQRVPHLFNYLQGKVDEDNIPGQFILSGSQNYLLMQSITQSLAGRVALFYLYPLTFSELEGIDSMPKELNQALFNGYYPALYEQSLTPADFYPSYVETYLERDVRSLTAVHDLVQFRNFVRLCAGRIGQPLNYQSLASDVGVSPVTIKSWIGILETSHLVFVLPPYFHNFNKRITKSPKLYFYDTGLAAWLLGAYNETDLSTHFARGALFENLIVAEMVKQEYHAGRRPQLYFWKDSNQREIDVLAEQAGKLTIVEIKSGMTINPHFFDNLLAFQKTAGDAVHHSWLIYGGDDNQQRSQATVRSWRRLEGIL